MSWSTPAYFAGVATVPVAVALLVVIVLLTETGETIQCRVCGYSTGPMRTTMRITKWTRWQWHKIRTRRHHRRALGSTS